MNKAELITKVSEKANVTQKVAKVIVDTLFDGMKESLEKGERIEIRGLGSFVVRDYGGYKGRNPKTGKIVDVPLKKLLITCYPRIILFMSMNQGLLVMGTVSIAKPSEL